MRPFVPAFCLLAACESGLSTVVEVTVDDAVATAHSEASPGVLVTDAGMLKPIAPLCGEPLAEPVLFSFDHGFGCLGDREGSDAVLRAWVQPMPEEWDAAAFCALQVHEYAGLSIGDDVLGEDPATVDTAAAPDPDPVTAALAAEPDPSWPQGEVTATWKRDFSPCGGILRGALTVR